MRDYYAILGVPPNASEAEIKAAFHQLVKVWHPDVRRRPDAHERFIEIGEAYEILVDPVRRSEYDRVRAATGPAWTARTSRGREYASSETVNEARRRAEQYYNTSIDDLLDELLKAVTHAAVVVGRATWFGEDDRCPMPFGARLWMGFKGILLITMAVLALTGILAPVSIPFGILIFRSLSHKGRFVGLETFSACVFQALGIILALLLAILALLYAMA